MKNIEFPYDIIILPSLLHNVTVSKGIICLSLNIYMRNKKEKRIAFVSELLVYLPTGRQNPAYSKFSPPAASQSFLKKSSLSDQREKEGGRAS